MHFVYKGGEMKRRAFNVATRPRCVFFLSFSMRHRRFASQVKLFLTHRNICYSVKRIQLLKLVSTPINTHSPLPPLLAVNLQPSYSGQPPPTVVPVSPGQPPPP